MKIKDCIKDKQKFADRVGVTRPWLYKLMDRYDTGDYSGIPEKVLREFKNAENRYYDDSNIPLDIDLTERAEDLLSKIDEIKETIRLKEKEYEGHDAEGHPGFKDINWYMGPRVQLEAEINDLNVQANELAKEYDSVMKEKARLSNTIYIDTKTIGIGEMDTYPFFDGNKYMITWDCFRGSQEFILTLFINLKGSYHQLKEYYPEDGENYIIIDDVVFDAPLFYTIDCDYEDINGKRCRGEITGMTRLKPVANEA